MFLCLRTFRFVEHLGNPTRALLLMFLLLQYLKIDPNTERTRVKARSEQCQCCTLFIDSFVFVVSSPQKTSGGRPVGTEPDTIHLNTWKYVGL